MSPRYRLAALDLDGTALGEDPERFAPGLLEAAAAAARAGVEVVFATGRPRPCMPAQLVRLRPDWLHTLICCDGAQVWDLDTGALLWQKALSGAALVRAAALAEALDLPVEYIDSEGWYHVTGPHLRQLRAGPLGDYHRGVLARRGVELTAPPETLAPLGILKLNLPRVPPDKAPTLVRALAEAGVQGMECGPGSFEVTAPEAGKQAAVAFAAGRLGLGMQSVMALGDSGNDAALLRAAGWGVAMGNAPEAVRRAADAVAPSNIRGGAAWAIRRWLLEEPVDPVE